MKKNLFVLLLIILLLLTATGAAWALDTAYPYLQQIGEGATYYAVDGTDSAGVQKTHYIEYTPNADILPVIAYGNKLYGRSTITQIEAYMKDLGYDVVAALNADFFTAASGVPVGLVVNDGRFISSPGGYPAVGFKADGTAVIGKPSVVINLIGPDSSLRVTSYNKSRSKNTPTLMDANFSAETRTSSAGINVVMEKINPADVVTLNCSLALRVASVNQADTSVAIGANQIILTVDRLGPVDSIAFLKAGDEVTMTVTADEVWQDVLYAVGGKTLINAGTVDTADNPTGNNPRSAVGIKADGTLVLYEADGRKSGISVGMTPAVLAQELQALGCVYAINLDGGGSSSMLVRYPGDSGGTLVNNPSDGSARACANYILLVNKAPKLGDTAHLHLYPLNKYLLAGASTAVTVKATDSNYHAVAAPTSVLFEVSEGAGSFDGNIFTAGTRQETVTVSAFAGSAEGSQYISVFDRIDKITLHKQGEAAIVSSLNPLPGQLIDLQATAAYLNLTLGTADNIFVWQTEGDVGTIDSQGVFTAGEAFTSGKIIASYNGYAASIPVSVRLGDGQAAKLIADFEAANPFVLNDELSLATLSKQTADAHNGKSALRLDYDFGEQTSLKLNISGIAVNADLDTLQLWYYGDGSGAALSAIFTDAAGKVLTAALGEGIKGNYSLLACAVPQGAVYFNGLMLSRKSSPQAGGTVELGAAKGTVYLDQLLFASAADGNAPEISIDPPVVTDSLDAEVTEGEILEGDSLQLTATVTDEGGRYAVAVGNIRVFLDGTPLSFSVGPDKGRIIMETGALSAGMHRLTVKAQDVFANKAVKTLTFTVGEAANQFSDLEGHWATAYVNYVAKQGIVAGEADKEGNLLFNPARNLSRAEFAVMMVRYLGLEPSGSELPFADLADIPAWALSSVAAVYDAGIMTGSSDKSGNLYFKARDGISRREAMAVIGRTIERGYVVPQTSFADSADIPAWAKPHVELLAYLGVVGGYEDGSIKPLGLITRAEIAKIFAGLY